MGLTKADLPGAREDPSTWPALRQLFTKTFKSKSRSEWEQIFDGTDACCTPVLEHGELEQAGFDQRPLVTLRATPGLSVTQYQSTENDAQLKAAKGSGSGVPGNGWVEEGLSPGVGGEETLEEWLGWKRGRQFDVTNGGLVLRSTSKL